jgi:hypothetical protein
MNQEFQNIEKHLRSLNPKNENSKLIFESFDIAKKMQDETIPALERKTSLAIIFTFVAMTITLFYTVLFYKNTILFAFSIVTFVFAAIYQLLLLLTKSMYNSILTNIKILLNYKEKT